MNGKKLKTIRDLDLNLLHVFEAIYSTSNISRAAQILDLSQPAMSNALTRLRKQIGDPLFIREGNGVSPTSKAESLISPVRSILNTVSTSIGTTHEFDPQTSERVFKLIVVEPVEQLLMTKLIEIIGYDTRIKFELLPSNSITVEDALLKGAIDLVVHLPGGQVSGIESEMLCPVDLVAIARKDHPRIGETLNIQQMQAERRTALFLDPSKMANSEKLTYWQKHIKEPIVVFSKLSAIAQLVSNTDLIAAMPRIYARQVEKIFGLKIAELQIPVPELNIHMTWHRRTSDDGGHKWLRDNVRKIVGDYYQTLI